MNRLVFSVFLIFALSLATNCKKTKQEDTQLIDSEKSKTNKNLYLLEVAEPLLKDETINAIIEIPAGTLEKWEVNKTSGIIERDSINGVPRTIQYIGYPGNYGMIPKTLLSKENGGDGDPLDILVLGPPVERCNIVNCKIIGVLNLIDRGENDDKIIAVSMDSPLHNINSIEELNDKHKGISEILKLWFTNYKGDVKVEAKGFKSKEEAYTILVNAIEDYQLKHK